MALATAKLDQARKSVRPLVFPGRTRPEVPPEFDQKQLRRMETR